MKQRAVKMKERTADMKQKVAEARIRLDKAWLADLQITGPRKAIELL
jgi:hypothetical protein